MNFDNLKKKSDATKINVAIDYLVKNIPVSEIIKKYRVSKTSVYSWLKNEKILTQIAKSTNKSLEEMRRIRAFKSIRKKTPKVIADYIMSDEKLMETISNVVFALGDETVGVDNVMIAVLNKVIPGGVKYSIFACDIPLRFRSLIDHLIPYLGKMMVGKQNLPPEDYIRRVPSDLLKGDADIEHELYRRVKNNRIRQFYDNPEHTIEEVKQKAEIEEHEFVRGLFTKLHSEFKDIYEFGPTMLTGIVDKIPNPEYRGDKINGEE